MRDTVFDPVRKKRVALTPEEEVRQRLIGVLSETKGYPLHLMSCEYSIVINGNKFRGDLVVFSREAKPLMLAECKAPSVKISRSVFEQILTYNRNLGVKHILLTNGPETYFASYEGSSGSFVYKNDIPDYNELSKE